jgi:hypothetical protein
MLTRMAATITPFSPVPLHFGYGNGNGSTANTNQLASALTLAASASSSHHRASHYQQTSSDYIASTLHALVHGDAVILLPSRSHAAGERGRRIRLRLTLDMASLHGAELTPSIAASSAASATHVAIHLSLADIQRVCNSS